MENYHIGVIGLGYVGLPLAVALGRRWPTIGLDIDRARVDELRRGIDSSRECTSEELASARRLTMTTSAKDLADCNFYIVTVPTPIDAFKRPDLGPVVGACETVAPLLAEGDIVVFESTVYPGCTEEVCVPILERLSGLVHNRDFFTGYSPERINPGDRVHRLETITKVTAGSTPETAERVDALYREIIEAGTHKASSIRVAEAAKVIENTQRDLNIALINELALIFNRLGIDTLEVLEAAGTKWNFLPFRPGLVGGHCIGVDPYYLTHKAQEIGYHPEVILAGRRINDSMGGYIAQQVVKLMIQKGINVVDARVLVLGLTFKEDCPDLRNTRVTDIVDELRTYRTVVDVHDPWADPDEARREYGIDLLDSPATASYDAVVLAVGHREYRQLGAAGIRAYCREGAVLYDVKSVLARTESDARL